MSARIRTIKPELLRHEELYALEKATGLPIRISWAGLFTVCDREGRFKWKPKQLKLDVLPFDDIDFSRVLDALEMLGLVVRYENSGQIYGYIPTWKLHQVINNKERASSLPDPNDSNILLTRDDRVSDVNETPLFPTQGEGKGTGREEERELEGEGSYAVGSPIATREPRDKKLKAPREEPLTNKTWEAYSKAYRERHRAEPVRNKLVNSQLANFVKRLGADEAPEVAAFYLTHNEFFYVKAMHPVSLMLRDAEKLRTEWKTNTRTTGIEAKHQEGSDFYRNQLDRIERGEL